MGNAFKAFVILAASFSIAFASNTSLVFRLAYAVSAIVVICFFWSHRNLSAIEVRRHPPETRSQVGRTIRELLHVRNRSYLPNLYVELYDYSSFPGHQISHALPLMPKAARGWEVRSPCSERGRFTLGPYSLTTADPFGVFKWRRFIAQEWTVIVYPPTYDLPRFHLPSGELIGGRTSRRSTHFVTPSVGGIREYAPGDGFNRIHWPYTAKTGRLMAKEFELDPASDVWIALDLQRQAQAGEGLESTTEYGVALAASLAKHFLDQNVSVGVVAQGAWRTVIPGDRGPRQLIKVLEELALVRPEGETAFAETLAAEGARFGRNTTVIAISPSTDESWADGLKHLAYRGTKTLAIHLEASTFGEVPSSLLLIGALAAGNIPAYVIKKGDNLGEVLCPST